MTSIDVPTVQARATARYLHRSPYKVRQVLSLVRGLPVVEAERVLQLCAKEAADDVLKVLESAIANAEHNNQLPADELKVVRAWCDEGPTRKWGQARARGRYFRVRHRSSHITIVVERLSEDELEARRRREERTGVAARGSQRRRAERVRRSRAAQQAAAEHEHEHDHDHEHDHGPEAEAAAGELADVVAEAESDDALDAGGEAGEGAEAESDEDGGTDADEAEE